MRFIGNKELIAPEIRKLLSERDLLSKDLVFFDAFCGTGAVSNELKDRFDIVLNDNLQWCGAYSKGRIVGHSCKFNKLGFDPFEYLNARRGSTKGFFFRNYSPGGSKRMYFTPGNAAQIDFIRKQIEDWRNNGLISDDEFSFLMASLIESVSLVSNTAGVYGAFLKHWDPRAEKPFVFSPVDADACHAEHRRVNVLNYKIEEIIADVDCDILYLDPPYTQNQYGTQYHLLETLMKNDQPPVSEVTGSRPTSPMRSDWSKDVKKHILFDRVVAKTKADYIVCSYSPDGFMSRSYIEAVLKRYGNSETLICQQLPLRRYTNFKSHENGDHFEYLFFIEKKSRASVYFTSPLNYIGSKTRMLPFLKQHFPPRITKFIDAFGGGFNVGINSDAKVIVYNDYNHLVSELIESFQKHDTFQYVQFVRRQIAKFGLEPENAKKYLAARECYNSLPEDRRDPRLLYSVIMYGFNQQIRFNSEYQFNNPVGQRWFNEKVLEKLVSFSRIVKEKNIVFRSVDYTEVLHEAEPGSFVYMDPPYRLTTGAYNDGKRGFKGWDEAAEQQLFASAEKLHSKSIKFMLSYVLGHKGRTNTALTKWLSNNNFRLVKCEETQGVGRREVIIVNYDNDKPAFYNQEQFSEGRRSLSGHPHSENLERRLPESHR